jgi:ABC-type transport system substrate-binding protein
MAARLLTTLLAAAVLVGALPLAAGAGVPTFAQSEGEARIVGAAPGSWDPVRQGDVATAATLAQVFEGLTAFDAESRVQPALAERWEILDEGRRVVFHLRSGLRFSDGSAITSDDVVASWLHLIDPERPGPLASLLDDVEGATAYARGDGTADQVGISAGEGTVEVRLRRPAAYFVSVTASPSLAVIPAGAGDRYDTPTIPTDIAASGAYVPTAETATSLTLEANPEYWAGAPSVGTIHLVTDLEGRSPVQVFEDGELDMVGIGAFDASWIRYDPVLGPQLRSTVDFSVEYYGFDTSRPPFDDVRVRRAFVNAVDWDRIVRLGDPEDVRADSLVPAGIVGRSETDFRPEHDPAAARADLAAAGYPGGEGFPATTLVSAGLARDEAVLQQLEDELGVRLELEVPAFSDYLSLLQDDTPQFWNLSWIADYPAPHDFLGLLAQTGSSNNYTHWSNAEFDAALEDGASTDDVREQERAYDRAQEILREDAPLVPVAYGRSWWLSAEGLKGASQSGLGLPRYASLEWDR